MQKQTALLAGSMVLAFANGAQALELEFGEVTGTLKSNLSLGAAVRTEAADTRLIGKLNVNGQQNLCNNATNPCVSFTGDPAPNQRIVNARGAFSGANKDDGDVNYSQWGVVAAITKLSSDLNLSYDNFTFKAGVIAFFDPSQYRRDNRHPDTTYQPGSTPRSFSAGHELGQDYEIKDALVAGKFRLFEHDFNAAVGYQHIRWGESNFVALNTLNEINPPDQRLLHQPGTPINEVFRPTPLLSFNTQIADGLSLDLFYQFAWRGAFVDPPGSFYSNLDFYNSDTFLLSLGQFHEDPNRQQRIPFPVSAISNSSFTAQVLPLSYGRPDSQGQFGGKLTWYAPDFNGGTEFGFYAMNYHSRLPYFSAIAANESCARNANGFAAAFSMCNGFIGLNPTTGREPAPLDTAKIFFEYPENIQLLGVSFNTNAGKWSLAGEYSIHPNLPLQVAASDIFFAALQPALPRQDITVGLTPQFLLDTANGVPTIINGVLTNPSSGAQQAAALIRGTPTLLQTFQNGNTTLPSSRSAVPDFISGYRGQEIQPNQIIHGYERFVVDQIQLTAIRALGSSDNPFGAEQVLILTEIGLTHVYGLPKQSRLQLEGGDNNATHASPGADGTGRPNGTPDARSLNPTQQRKSFASEFSAGIRTLVRFEYNNLIGGLNFKPQIFIGYDPYGISPLPAQNFREGTLQYLVGTEIEAGGPWSGQVFYQGSTLGGTLNNQRDRDVIGAAVAYTF
ncbi:MAG: hypothetical protein NVS9B10_13640 [Nevskia sp.]